MGAKHIRHCHWRGFALTEVLIAIGVVGVLVSIAIPFLSESRSRSREVKCLSNLRGTGAAIEAYLGRYASRYPFSPGGVWVDSSPDHDWSSQAKGSNWDMRLHWPALMHDVAPWRVWYPTWVCPGSPRRPGEPWQFTSETGDWRVDAVNIPSYWYSDTFLARPQTWSIGTPASEETLVKPVSNADVLFPSSKVVMYDHEKAHLAPKDNHDSTPMLFADSHAAVKRLSQAMKPGINVLTGSSRPLNDTLHGVRGLDY